MNIRQLRQLKEACDHLKYAIDQGKRKRWLPSKLAWAAHAIRCLEAMKLLQGTAEYVDGPEWRYLVLWPKKSGQRTVLVPVSRRTQ